MNAIAQLATNVLGQLKEVGSSNLTDTAKLLRDAGTQLTTAADAPASIQFRSTLSQSGQALLQASSMLGTEPTRASSLITTARFGLDLLVPG